MKIGWQELLALSQEDESLTNIDYFERRLPARTYISKSFKLGLQQSSDFNQPTRHVWKVFDQLPEETYAGPDAEKQEWTVRESAGGRVQILMQVTRETGSVREIAFQKAVTRANGERRLSDFLTLNRQESARLVELFHGIESVDPTEDQTEWIDATTLGALAKDKTALAELYKLNPDVIRSLIASDSSAEDLLGLAYRREQLDIFREMLSEEDSYDELAWQRFFEANPWLLGVSLTAQVLASWDSSRLEQVVVGHSVSGSGKRNDALMRTAGVVQSFVLVEIKKPTTDLLEPRPYRAGCWAPSRELAGGVTQIQQTSHLAAQDIGTKLESQDPEGYPTGDYTYMLQPKSFLVAGNLKSLQNDQGRVHDDKFRSFEIFRRNLVEPTILTFDEVLARAEWQLEFAERTQPDRPGETTGQ
jgi:hypothetical protein